METNIKHEHHESAATLNRVLSLNSLIFYGLAFMVPLTIFTTYGLVTSLTHGMVALTYVVTTICMAFIAFSYVRMVKAYPVAGSVYTYVSQSVNPYIGFLSGWVILIGYIFLPMLNYLISAIFLAAAFPQVPAYVWIVSMILIVTVVNHFGITVTDFVNKSIVWIQIIFLAVFIFLMVKYIMGGGGAGTMFDWNAVFNAKEFAAQGMGFPILLAGASILSLSFLGFDAISTLSEEAIDPEKNIPRAILIACIGAGIGFTVITYMMQLAWPAAWTEMVSPDGGSYELIVKVAGDMVGYVFSIVYAVGCLASSISSVSSASRVLYGMGRDNLLPKRIFGYLHYKYQTPTFSILIIAVLSFGALAISLTTAASLLNFGALLAFTMVNVSVIAHYFIRGGKRSGMDAVRYLIAPAIGAVISFSIWMNLDIFSKYLGFAWIGIGFVYLVFTTKFFRELPKDLVLE